MNFFLLVLIAFVVFFAIDIVWLSFIAKKLYQKELGFIMAKKVNWVAAFIFYVLFIVGLVFFAIQPAIQAGDIGVAFLNGSLFGLMTYATYDLTNLATLEKWPLKITIIDLIWGTFLGTSVTVITFLIGR